MIRQTLFAFLIAVPLLSAGGPSLKKAKLPPPSPIDQMIHEAEREKREIPKPSPGSLYSSRAPLANFTREFRAEDVNDLVTVLVSDNTSAVTNGTTNTQRKSSSTATFQFPLGQTLGNGLSTTLTGNNQLQGQGTTLRNSTLTASLTVRVTHVLPGGTMVVEGMKQIDVNSEHQWVSIRGVIRARDLTPANTVNSDQVADMELKVNGKGVVNDYIKRPNLLYRILNGMLPF
ncbi:MAG TPA: flagellar basal body L-ring protein FlgH [Bryobacteraceae bacterium]|jgi:flagellar L-ring protein precursor FlgH